MKHLLDVDQLSQQDVNQLIQNAMHYKQKAVFPLYPLSPLATLFYENSTRTRVSFELAAKQLGMPVVNLDLQTSSEKKGEIIDDTFQTLVAMGIKFFVIRHSQDGLPGLLASRYGDSVHIINAGDGQHAHPTQALLDFMTILEHKPDVKRLKIAIVGDLRHSRVANSLQQMCSLMEVADLALISPESWQPKHVYYGHVTTSLKEGLERADVVICLRVQNERMLGCLQIDELTYRKLYAVTKQTLAYAKADAIVMHPGPMNRGIEIDSEVADGAQSVILQQVKNGVYMRMAILDVLAQEGN